MAPNRLIVMWQTLFMDGGIGGFEDGGGGDGSKAFFHYYLKHVVNIGDLS